MASKPTITTLVEGGWLVRKARRAVSVASAVGAVAAATGIPREELRAEVRSHPGRGNPYTRVWRVES